MRFVWETGFDAPFLLKQLGAIRTVSEGRCGFEAGAYRFWKPVLYSAIRYKLASQSVKRRSIDAALHDPEMKLGDADAFIARCELAAETLIAAGKEQHVILCDVTYSGPDLATTLVDGDCTIQWNPSPNSRFMKGAAKAREQLAPVLERYRIAPSSAGLTPLLVRVPAFDLRDAHDTGMDAVDRLRGILNLLVNVSRQIDPFGFDKPEHAVNRFRLGPYRTIHKPDGTMAGSQFWYEPRWEHQSRSARFAGDISAVKKDIRHWRSLAMNNPLAETVGVGLVRYCRALDLHGRDEVIMGLWSTIEYLTNAQQEKYDVTVSRVSKLFQDTAEARLVVNHLRLVRNSTIHAGRSTDSNEADIVISQADSAAAQLLFFLITNRPKLKSKEELVRFLDLDVNEKYLRRQRKLIEGFIAYRNRKNPKAKIG